MKLHNICIFNYTQSNTKSDILFQYCESIKNVKEWYYYSIVFYIDSNIILEYKLLEFKT